MISLNLSHEDIRMNAYCIFFNFNSQCYHVFFLKNYDILKFLCRIENVIQYGVKLLRHMI